MRELTRWQIIQACGLGSQIDTVIVDVFGAHVTWPDVAVNDLEAEERAEKIKKINAYLERESKSIPPEMIKHLNFLTYSGKITVELTFKDLHHAEAD